MKRSGFTMVELIFVIVIIGILAATALPKFTSVKDNAKANSEISAMSSIEGAIAAKREFRLQDYNDNNVSWHDKAVVNPATAVAYKDVNIRKGVLKAIVKKGDKFRIVGFATSDAVSGNSDTNSTADVLVITGPATDSSFGLNYPAKATNSDIAGKPDKNDFWIFNPNTYDVNVTGTDISAIVPAESSTLVDKNGTSALVPSSIAIKIVNPENGATPAGTVINVDKQ